MPSKNVTPFKIRGRNIQIDDKGRIRLNDIHSAGGFTVNQRPTDWGALQTTIRLIGFTASKTSGNSGPLSKDQIKSVYCVRVGRYGGIWAHPNLALAYAKYLSPSLHYDVNEVFLRHKAGDPTLADETLQRATPQGNEWAAVRALGRAKRRHFTDVLQEHEVVRPLDFAIVTNAVYGGLWGRTAATLKSERGLKKTANLRDALDTNDLVYVMAGEQLAAERIGYEDRRGVSECSVATTKSASFIRRAIEADRADRRKPAP